MGKIVEMKRKAEDYLYTNMDCLSTHEVCEMSKIIKNLSEALYYCKETEEISVKNKNTEYKELDSLERIRYLNQYMTKLNDDLIEMIKNTSAEDKQVALNKLNEISQHILMM